jgi:hypothetical protein
MRYLPIAYLYAGSTIAALMACVVKTGAEPLTATVWINIATWPVLWPLDLVLALLAS